jgi:hypothetical protein
MAPVTATVPVKPVRPVTSLEAGPQPLSPRGPGFVSARKPATLTVNRVRHWFQVPGIYASAVTAEVINNQADRNLGPIQLVGDTMGNGRPPLPVAALDIEAGVPGLLEVRS